MAPKEKDAKKDAKKTEEKSVAPKKEEKKPTAVKPAAKKAAAKTTAAPEGPSRKEMIKAADEMNELMDLDPVIDTTQPDDKLRANIIKEAKEIVPDDVFSDATNVVLKKLSCIKFDEPAAPAADAKSANKDHPKTKSPSTPRARKTDGLKIRLLVKTNPKKVGAASHARFELYKSGMSVGDALAAGVTHQDIWWDVSHKFIELKK